MNFDNSAIKDKISELRNQQRIIKEDYRKKHYSIQEIINNLESIQDSEEIIVTEKNGKRDEKINLIPAKDFDGSPISDERKQKILDHCMQKLEMLSA